MQRDSQTELDTEQRAALHHEAEFETAADFDPEDFEPQPLRLPDRRRVAMVLGVLLVIFCAAVLPPLISVNRFRNQITGSISASLGRPVHMDSVTLDILPWPGFTLENFVVGEDPGFGTEPVIYARSVHARLRLRSLWRRPVEFSRITLDDPSINLVHRADGRWNVESILLQASKIQAEPTAQTAAGRAPRFPYISATGARVNIKMGLEKMPLSLTEADFALWLPEPRQWHLRLEAHPTRTDGPATDTGTVTLEGSLGKASSLEDAPVNLSAEWKAAPLGAASRVLIGRDAGFRGELNLHVGVAGTIGRNALDSRMEITNLRRADFVPAQMLDLEAGCKATTSRLFHQLDNLRCVTPTGSYTPQIVLTGEMPDLFNPAQSTGAIDITKLPADGLLDVLRLATPRVSPDLSVAGSIGGSLAIANDDLTGSVMITGAQLKLDGGAPYVDGEAAFEVEPGDMIMRPIGLHLGAPAPASLDAKLSRAGLTMHLSGAAMRSRLLELAAALPQFGDGLLEALPPEPVPPPADGTPEVEQPIHVDLVSNRPWFGPQTWMAAAPSRPVPKRHRRR